MPTDPIVQPAPWVAVADCLPPQHQEVVVLIADPRVAIHAHPTVARLQIDEFEAWKDRPRRLVATWWAGVPGKWMRLPADGWAVTHWARMPVHSDGDEHHARCEAAAWELWEANGAGPQLARLVRAVGGKA